MCFVQSLCQDETVCVCACARVYEGTDECVYVHVHVCMRVPMSVCMCVCEPDGRPLLSRVMRTASSSKGSKNSRTSACMQRPW